MGRQDIVLEMLCVLKRAKLAGCGARQDILLSSAAGSRRWPEENRRITRRAAQMLSVLGLYDKTVRETNLMEKRSFLTLGGTTAMILDV